METGFLFLPLSRLRRVDAFIRVYCSLPHIKMLGKIGKSGMSESVYSPLWGWMVNGGNRYLTPAAQIRVLSEIESGRWCLMPRWRAAEAASGSGARTKDSLFFRVTAAKHACVRACVQLLQALSTFTSHLYSVMCVIEFLHISHRVRRCLLALDEVHCSFHMTSA
jgi:hypothetical protein